MKLFKFLALSLLVFSFMSCKSDKDSTPTDGAIAGEWRLESGDFEGTMNMDGIGVHVSGFLKDIDPSNWVDFKSDGAFEAYGGNFTMVITIDFMGTPITEEVEIEEGFSDGTWSREGNSLTITDDNSNEATTYKIEKLTASQLVISANFTDVDPELDGDIPFFFRFEKI